MKTFNESKEEKFTRLNKKLFDFIKKAEKNNEHLNDYSQILDKLAFDPRMTLMNFKKYKNKSSNKKESGYANKIVDQETKEYLSFRVGDHLPNLYNIFSKAKEGFPSQRKCGNVCILFFGSEEIEKLKGSQKGNYTFSKEDYTISTLNEFQVERVKFMYSNGYKFNYKIYHYVPYLISDNSLQRIVTATENWYNNDGNSDFDFPVPDIPEARPMKAPIECEITFEIDEKYLNEDIDNTKIISSGTPIFKYYMGDLIYEIDNKEVFRVKAYFNVVRCLVIQYPFLEVLFGFKPIIDDDSQQKSTIVKKSDNTKSEKKKK